MCNCGKRRVVSSGGGGGRSVGVVGRGVMAPAPVAAPAPVPVPAPVPAPSRTTYIPMPPVRVNSGARPVARQVPMHRRSVWGGAGAIASVGMGTGGGPIVDPALWGPPLWRLLHTLAEVAGSGSGSDVSADWSRLFAALRTALPCPDCTRHYTAWYAAHPFVSDPATWILALHNDVNRRRGANVWTTRDVSTTYGIAMMTDLQALLTRVRGFSVGEEACAVLERIIVRLM
jgi:hypothetical protein